MGFKRRVSGVPGLQTADFLGQLVFPRSGQLGRAGQFAQIILPVRRAGRLLVVYGVAVLGAGFRLGLDKDGLFRLLQKRIFQKLPLDRFHQLQAR